MADEIAVWLAGIGLEKYAEQLAAQDIDLRSLPYLTESDLRELGVSLGHRKIMLAAIASLPPHSSLAGEATSAAQQSRMRNAARPNPTDQAERRLVSVLFCDIVGSTELARHLDPEDMRHLLRDYQNRVAGSVARYGGHLAQYLGDGVMAFFGWPTAYEDQAERAARAGIEVIEAIKTLDAGSAAPIRSRIAIATGQVVVGDLSSAGRQEGAIAGETPNLAARLQQFAEPDQLVICETTHGLVGDVFEIASHSSHSLKGFDGQTRLYRVAGLRSFESRFDAARGQNLSSFVGRTHELALTLEKWELAKAGEGQAVLISGEAGIGKSRLARVAAEHVGSETHIRWQLQCSPYHASSTLYPVIQSLLRALDLEPDDTVAQRLDKLEALLRVTSENVAAAAPIFAELLSIETAGRYPSLALTPQELKSLTLDSLVERCLATARVAPLLLLVEDVHWIDPTTRELIEQTIARISNARILVVVTHRPDWRTEWANQYGHVTSLTLGKLPRPQIAELVKNLIGTSADDDIIGEIAARTDGVPMFVEEVARSLVEAGTKEGTGAARVPTTLQGALMARLDSLSAAAKEVVQASSVMGREFFSDAVASVCRRTRADAEAALDELMRGRLITRGNAVDAFTFRHALIQEVAYQSLLRGKRRELHKAMADTLMRLRPETTETQPELLAHHLTEAALPAQALPLWRRAGQRALARFANDEAIQHFKRALEVAGRLPEMSERDTAVLAAEIQLGEAQLNAGHMLAAIETFQHSADRARALQDKFAFATSVLGFDEAKFLSNEPLSRSLVLLREALAMHEMSDGRDHCRILTRLSRACTLLGDTELADSYGRGAIDMARKLQDDSSLIEAMIIGFLSPRPGLTPVEMRARLGQLDELLDAVQQFGDGNVIGRVFSLDIYQAAEYCDRERMDERIAKYTLWIDKRDMLLHRWIVRHGCAMQAILDGDLALAERCAEDAFELGRRVHGEHAQGVYGMQMFTIRREQGRLAEVAPLIKRLLDEDADQSSWRPGFAIVASELGFQEPARRILEELAATGFALPLDGKRSTTFAYLAEVCATLADEARAEMLYDLLKPYRHMTITTGIVTVCYGSAGRYLGLLADVLGAWDGAEEHFDEALDVNRRMRAPPWMAHTQGEFSHMLKRRGRPADIRRADALFEEAWTTAQRLGMTALTEKLRRQQN